MDDKQDESILKNVRFSGDVFAHKDGEEPYQHAIYTEKEVKNLLDFLGGLSAPLDADYAYEYFKKHIADI